MFTSTRSRTSHAAWPPTDDLDYVRAVGDVMTRGVLTEGREVSRLERLFDQMLHGEMCCVGVSSGTAALEVLMMVHGVGPGDEVIVPAMTFTATAMAILRVGATPRFVDVREDFNIDPKTLEAVLGANTKAILAVHLHGVPARMSELQHFATNNGLLLLEDACAAAGARYGTRRVGSLADGAAFSLNRTKMVGGGQGGICALPNEGLAERARQIARWGEASSFDGRRSTIVGSNYKLDEITAAIARVSLGRLRTSRERSLQNVKAVQSAILTSHTEEIRLPDLEEFVYPSWHKLRLWTSPRNGVTVKQRLLDAGVPISTSEVELLPKMPVFAKYRDSLYPIAEAATRTTVVIGSHQRPLWTLDAQELECQVGEAMKGAGLEHQGRHSRSR